MLKIVNNQPMIPHNDVREVFKILNDVCLTPEEAAERLTKMGIRFTVREVRKARLHTWRSRR